MAAEAMLMEAGLRIGEGLHRFAALKGWDRESYRVYVSYNPNWDTIHIVLVSREIDPEKRSEQMSEALRFLRRDLKGVPKVWHTYGGVACRPDEPFYYDPPALADDEVAIPDALLNPGVENWRGLLGSMAR